MNRAMVAAIVLSVAGMSSQAQAAKFDPSESLANFQPELSEEFKQLLREGDVEAGADFFERKCANCHDVAKDGIHNKGPLLWNLFGRKAGSIKEFEYSEAMINSGHSWDYATINYYLTRTDRAVPGRIMNFRGIRKDKQRADLLLYLRQFNDNPPALP
ncbi:hypothetical protein DV711_09985 [Motiliproteus coralliicola]|uniref:Cytochrome c domain-containing protein n=1 Tax=Motiliproteus coralliicola TaxID=2283196 RepID=A0A369WLC1_9GAMM|nr:c-type cytochrome [Motiliproteus coralliicola]RDE22880.1 hypothetical protein DV711_09985 [Motiliproteus coralliicola]